jgi:hypothetical protein
MGASGRRCREGVVGREELDRTGGGRAGAAAGRTVGAGEDASGRVKRRRCNCHRACRGIGERTGLRPGAAAGGAGGGGRGPGLLVDMEIRYTLERGGKGIYTYAIFTHEPTYGATQIGESRYGMKLNGGLFDWLSIDGRSAIWRCRPGRTGTRAPTLNMKEARLLTTGVKKGIVEHKYDYCTDQFDTPAFGWSSTKQHVGIYFINPSVEYLSSGPDHFELTGHLDDGDGRRSDATGLLAGVALRRQRDARSRRTRIGTRWWGRS